MPGNMAVAFVVLVVLLNIFNAKKTYTKQLGRRCSINDIHQQMMNIDVSSLRNTALRNELQEIILDNDGIRLRCRHIKMRVTIDNNGVFRFKYNLKMLTNALRLIPGLLLLVIGTASAFTVIGGLITLLFGDLGGVTWFIVIVWALIVVASSIALMHRSRKKAMDAYGKATAETIAQYIN